MKKINIKIYVLLILFSLGCSEDILHVENKNKLTVDGWYNSALDFEAALNSAYIAPMEQGLFGLRIKWNLGTFADRILFETTGRDMMTTLTPTSDGSVHTWRHLYHGVYRSTRLLMEMNNKGMEGIEDMTEGNFNYIAAQAKAIRAFCYFYLTILFDRPILYDETNYPEDPNANLPNANQIDLWLQIEKDLTEAIPYLELKKEQAPEDYGRVTKGGAQSLLAKALLYKHYYYHERFGHGGTADDVADLEKAKDLFLEVMNSNQYELIQPQDPKSRKDYLYALLSNSSYKDLNSENNYYKAENNAESVWEVQFHDGQAFENNPWYSGHYGGGAQNVLWFSPHQSSFKNWEVHPKFYYEFDSIGAPAPFDKDPRCYASIYFHGDTMDVEPNSPYYKPFSSITAIKRIALARKMEVPVGYGLGVKKGFFPVYWDGLLAPENDPTNQRVIRYADVLLMYAEIMHLLGDDGTGLDALNQVRRRVDMPDVPNLTKEAIIHERDIELAFESHRWLDLVRWSFSPEWGINWEEIEWGIDAENSRNPFVKGKHEFFPIPIFEIDVNDGALTQNPGW